MGVAAKVVQDFFGRRERAFGIDHPLLLAQGTNQVSKSSGFDESGSAAWELQLFFGEGLLDESGELAAKNKAEGFDRKEEGLTGRHPPGKIKGERPSGN